MKTVIEDAKASSHKSSFIVFAITILLIPGLFLSGFYFAFYVKYSCQEFEQRIAELEKYQELSQTVLLEITHSLSSVDRGYLNQLDNTSVSAKQKHERRIKRDTITLLKPVEKVKEKPNSSGNNIYNFRREMSTLNDRLHRLLRYDEISGRGSPGPPGVPGLPGKTGNPGPPGRNGRDGYHGNRGLKGPAGVRGPTGTFGHPGKDGLPGANGIPGLPGFMGLKGIKGETGRGGLHGGNGVPGQIGMTGQTGRAGFRGEKGEVGECRCPTPVGPEWGREKVVWKGAVTYSMWGSSTCPHSTDILYSGQISMSKYEQQDGKTIGSNAVCAPLHSRVKRSKRNLKGEEGWKLTDDKTTSLTSGTRIDEERPAANLTIPPPSSSGDEITPTVTVKKSPIVDENAPKRVKFVPKYSSLVGTRKYIPCAICHSEKKFSKLMIPSNSVCPISWNIEYTGYLMNYHHGTDQSQIICVNDQALGVSPSSDPVIRKLISAYMAPIKKECNSFSCHMAEQEKCVLCTKGS